MRWPGQDNFKITDLYSFTELGHFAAVWANFAKFAQSRVRPPSKLAAGPTSSNRNKRFRG
jgi:hypothetical protein